MEVHSPQQQTIQAQIDRLKDQQVARKEVAPFQDPIREFSRASKVEALVRNWLTYPIEERRRLIKTNFVQIPRYEGDPSSGRPGESERDFEVRQMERWRALCVIIQEESRAKAGNRSPEVAIGALKLLFPEHDWKVPAAVPPKG